jgi:hypothetical protein
MVSLAACTETPSVPKTEVQPTAPPAQEEKVAEAAGLTGAPAEQPEATATTAEPAEPIDASSIPGGYGVPNDKLIVDPANFDRSWIIDNKWFPLKPGTKMVYEGTTEEGEEVVHHRVEFAVTDLTKLINGIRALIVLDKDISGGQMEELENTYFAQDKNGDVWHLGQYKETYSEVKLVGGKLWVVGNPPGAQAGIMMHAEAKLGTDSYSEGYAPAPFNWTDRGRVFQIGQRTTVVAGSFEDVLVIEEFSEEEPGASQLKYYAPGVGVVRVGWAGNDPTRERLELIQVVQMTPEELAEIRAEALGIEQRAYMFCSTDPAQQITP